MLWLTVQGVKPWDGRYEFDLENQELTTREWGWVKKHAGYLPLTVDEGFKGGDPELFAVFAAIALRRANRITTTDVAEVIDRIAEAPFGTTIQIEDDQPDEDEREDDAGPPARSSTGSNGSSGEESTGSSATSPSTPPASGIPGSATSAFGPVRSGT